MVQPWMIKQPPTVGLTAENISAISGLILSALVDS